MHIAGEMVRLATGLPMTHIPYRGAAPAVADFLAGNIDLMIADTPVLLPQVTAGKMRALGVFGSARTPLLPDVATAPEQGQPSLVMENWYGVLAPPACRPSAARRWSAPSCRPWRRPRSRRASPRPGMQAGTGAAGFRAQLDRDQAQWPALLKQLDIRLD